MNLKINNHNYFSLFNLIKYLSIFVIIIGICFRFANLEDQVFNWDEVRGFYRLVGYVKQEVIDKLLTGDIVSVQNVQAYQHLSPEKDLTDAIYALANNPEHPPLFYLMARFWMHLFSSPYSVRILAVLQGILVFPCLYWLCIELFENKLLAWISVALFSISPYHIMLSQAARQYSLWTLLLVISSIFLLKALKNGKKLNWIIYGISITLGVYSHLFFAVTCVSQGIYVLIIEKFRFTKNTIAYLITSLTALFCFIPWIFVLFKYSQKFDEVTSWATKSRSSFQEIIIGNIYNIGDIFIDLANTKRFENYLAVMIFILFLASIYLLYQKTSPAAWLFIILLIFPPWLIQIIPDIIFQEGIRSLQPRYLVPSYLGIIISLAFLITKGIETQKSLIRFITILVFIFLIFLGLISGNYLISSHDWDYLYLKGTPMSRNLSIAPLINQSKNSLVISQASHHFILCLSYLIDDHVKFQLLTKNNANQWKSKLDIDKADQQFGDIFIYYPDQNFLDFLSQEWPNFKQDEIAKGLILLSSK